MLCCFKQKCKPSNVYKNCVSLVTYIHNTLLSSTWLLYHAISPPPPKKMLLKIWMLMPKMDVLTFRFSSFVSPHICLKSGIKRRLFSHTCCKQLPSAGQCQTMESIKVFFFSKYKYKCILFTKFDAWWLNVIRIWHICSWICFHTNKGKYFLMVTTEYINVISQKLSLKKHKTTLSTSICYYQRIRYFYRIIL